ncbi:hypothetical protein HPB48_007091 [Haemaphysalis longicornis]|uniref:Sushi domain-containing protein n=1 Tax=Haemaphysalis longicornis TaxID=44386 RepID=A0A9J6G1J0_HAELO|nr:hypothetical protein HPB48_007091 [Haemaphysalis longicornis]
MFPKPSPACGVYNDQTGVYLNTVPFDRVEPAANSTYEVRLHRVFQVRDWLAFRNLTFRCHIIVLGTDWRSGISHKLFGDAGCPPEPPEIVNGFYNVSGEETCWRTPAEGSLTRYYCLDGFELRGPRELVCRNGSWVLPRPLLASSAGTPQGPAAARLFKNIICGEPSSWLSIQQRYALMNKSQAPRFKMSRCVTARMKLTEATVSPKW